MVDVEHPYFDTWPTDMWIVSPKIHCRKMASFRVWSLDTEEREQSSFGIAVEILKLVMRTIQSWSNVDCGQTLHMDSLHESPGQLPTNKNFILFVLLLYFFWISLSLSNMNIIGELEIWHDSFSLRKYCLKVIIKHILLNLKWSIRIGQKWAYSNLHVWKGIAIEFCITCLRIQLCLYF